MKTRLLLALCLGGLPMLAQLPAPNAAGVAAGHDIMIVKDLEGPITDPGATTLR